LKPQANLEGIKDFEASPKAGGLKDASMSGLEGISEPQEQAVDYSYSPKMREYEQGRDYERSERSGGYSARRSLAATRSIDTQRQSDPFYEDEQH
ncbi:MAG: hypothetical protein K6F05_09370, partial [Succinivibrio sp.]|nr:hypothetical protein [Succinivibrio sp.]